MDIKFKKSKEAVVFSGKTAIKHCEEPHQIDPQLSFQRLITTVNRSEDEDISHVFEYELCSFPSAFFDSSSLPRQAQKSALADAIWASGECCLEVSEMNNLDVQHILDGGSLLQRIPWQQGKTYEEICNMYVNFIHRRYTAPVIVFDGYKSHPSTKDITHMRRAHGIIGSNVCFKNNTPFKGKKENFLTNKENKQNFIYMLGNALLKSGCKVVHAEDDADVLIVKTTDDCAKTRNVMLIGRGH